MPSWDLTGNSDTTATSFLGTTTGTGQPLVIKTNGEEAMRIAPDGKIGIGTTRPDARLQITSTDPQLHLTGFPPTPHLPFSQPISGSPATLRLTSGGTINPPEEWHPGEPFHPGGYVDAIPWDIVATGSELQFSPHVTNVGTVMALVISGNVGIGTNSPAAKLHISSPDQGLPQLQITQTTLNEYAHIRLQGPDYYVVDIGNSSMPPWDIQVGFGKLSFSCSTTSAVLELSENNTTVGNDLSVRGRLITSTDVVVSGKMTTSGDIQVSGNITTSGDIQVSGNITTNGDIFLTNADCAEEFDIVKFVVIEPGTVMVLDQEGALQPSQYSYDKKVAGVISGAGDYKPGIVLDKQQSQQNRKAIALVGKVYCKVDAQYAPIEVGDLLTTSPTRGHAMKAVDPFKAFGSVIGKALRPLKAGQGLIPILIALQ